MARTPPMVVRGPALVAAGCLALLTPGCRGSASPPAAAGREPRFSLREGERLFGSFCAPCHGESGRAMELISLRARRQLLLTSPPRGSAREDAQAQAHGASRVHEGFWREALPSVGK